MSPCESDEQKTEPLSVGSTATINRGNKDTERETCFGLKKISIIYLKIPATYEMSTPQPILESHLARDSGFLWWFVITRADQHVVEGLDALEIEGGPDDKKSSACTSHCMLDFTTQHVR